MASNDKTIVYVKSGDEASVRGALALRGISADAIKVLGVFPRGIRMEIPADKAEEILKAASLEIDGVQVSVELSRPKAEKAHKPQAETPTAAPVATPVVVKPGPRPAKAVVAPVITRTETRPAPQPPRKQEPVRTRRSLVEFLVINLPLVFNWAVDEGDLGAWTEDRIRELGFNLRTPEAARVAESLALTSLKVEAHRLRAIKDYKGAKEADENFKAFLEGLKVAKGQVTEETEKPKPTQGNSLGTIGDSIKAKEARNASPKVEAPAPTVAPAAEQQAAAQ